MIEVDRHGDVHVVRMRHGKVNALDLELLRLTGLDEAGLAPVVEALGYGRDGEGHFHRRKARRSRRQGRLERARPASAFAALGKIRVGR